MPWADEVAAEFRQAIRPCRRSRGTRLGTLRWELDVQFVAGFQGYGAFYRIFQLPHVAWPFVAA